MPCSINKTANELDSLYKHIPMILYRNAYKNFNVSQIYLTTEIFRFIWYSLPTKVCYNAHYFLIGTRRTFAVSTAKGHRGLDKV